jgi:glycosyltransferase involved in cell wall biosynthesis
VTCTVSPLRVLYLGWGDHVHLERWAGWFARAGHDVHVASLSGRGNYPPGVAQHVLNPAGRGDWFVRLRLAWLLMRHRPHVVHVHWAHFATLATVWKGPLAVTVWGSDVYRRDKFSDAEWHALGRALRRAQCVTCDSDDLEARLCGEFDLPPASVHVIQWGVDTHLFSPGEPSADFVQALELEGRGVIFSARNFTPLYNQETIVRAFARLVPGRPDLVLVMKRYGGDRGYVATIRALVTELGLDDRVRFCEGVPYERMPDFYRSAAVTVSVPFSDATPMALLEAMACGSVPVVSDLPSLREWVRDGENGRLVPADDVDALAAAIARALDDPELRRRAVDTNLRFVAEHASQDAHMRRMEALLRELAGAGARHRAGNRGATPLQREVR